MDRVRFSSHATSNEPLRLTSTRTSKLNGRSIRIYLVDGDASGLLTQVDAIIRTTGLDRNPCVFLSRKRLRFWDSTKEVIYAKEKAVV
jgi:hypothetical protein